MARNTQLRVFWFAAIAIAIVAFLAFLNMSRIFSSEMEVLLIPKSNTTAENIDKITADAENFPQALSFYDEMIKNGTINDPTKELPSSSRKAFWNSVIKTEKIDNSGIIKITAFSSDRVQAEIIDRQAVATLIGRLSQYYNIRTELDVRIIEDPVVVPTFSSNPLLLIVYSILLGLISGFLTAFIFSVIPAPKRSLPGEGRFNFSLANLPTFTKSEKKELKIGEEEKPIVFDKRPEAITSQKKEGPKKETIITPLPAFSFPQKKATAPGNLPIADEEAVLKIEERLYANGKKEEPKEEKKEIIPEKPKAPEEPKKDIFREATPEEVKERLNKLLSGN